MFQQGGRTLNRTDRPSDLILPAYAQATDLKAAEAARLLSVHLNTMKKMLQRGYVVGAYRIGSRGDWRVPLESIAKFKERGGTR